MKKFLLTLAKGVLVFLLLFNTFTISASSIDFVSEKSPYVKVICGNYYHIFSTADYGYSMSRTLVQALETAGRKAGNNRKAYVYVSKGNYKLHNTLLIYSNTTLVSEGSTFSCYSNMLRNGYDNQAFTAEKYNGSRNITVIGGTWHMEVPYEYAATSDFSLTHSTFRFAHCKNITIKNCTFENNYNSHDIELGGVYNARITNCNFSNDKSVNKFNKTSGREAIQIDVNTEKAVPYLPEYDYTQCQKITISDCHFENKFRGIGSHHGVIGKPYEKIKIYNNSFKNISAVAVSGIYWNNTEIYNNKMENVGSGIEVCSVVKSKNFVNYNNYSYAETVATIRNSEQYIYGNQISVRENNNHLKRKFAIKISGCDFKEDNLSSNIKKGIYHIYNVNLGSNPSGEIFENKISGITNSDVILRHIK